MRFWTQGPEEMCLLGNQNPSKTSKKNGLFDRIVYTANQKTEGSEDLPQSPFGRRVVRRRGYGLRLLIFKISDT